jgi:hypothetical protein
VETGRRNTMNRLFSLSYLLALAAVLALNSRGVAQQRCAPFNATSVVSVTPLGGGAFSINGSGSGTPIGSFTQAGTAQFFLVGKGSVQFTSTTVISTPAGNLYTAEMGSSTFGRAAGTFRIVGGTGAYAGVSGAGSFKVAVNTNGTQTATYVGVLCLSSGGN